MIQEQEQGQGQGQEQASFVSACHTARSELVILAATGMRRKQMSPGEGVDGNSHGRDMDRGRDRLTDAEVLAEYFAEENSGT